MPERYPILLVDDNPADRQAIMQALKRGTTLMDFPELDIIEVDSIALAREMLRQSEFACVFLDHELPDGSSLDLLLDLRGLGLATPVVVLTGERDDQIVAEAMRAGAADYLPKTRLQPDTVARTLRAALRFLGAQREKQAVLNDLHVRDRAIAAATNGIVIADARLPDCPLVYVNQSFLLLSGYDEDEIIGHNCRFLQGPKTDPNAVLELREAVQNQRGCQVLILNYRKDGTTFWNEVTVSPVRNAQGELTHYVGIQTDITARYEADGERVRLLALATEQAHELNALYEREHRIAEALQRSLLNTPPKQATHFDVETVYQAAWEEAQVGGDFFDVFALDGDRLALVVGDVSGKGLQAASRTAEVKYTLRAYLREFVSPGPALSRLNAFLCEAQALEGSDLEYFVVLTLAVVNGSTGAAEIAVAGAEPPLLLSADGTATEVQVGGMPLGVAAKAEYTATTLSLDPGALLLVTTDGITEARRGHEFLGNDGLMRLAQNCRSAGTLAQIGQAILSGAQAFADGRLHDDVCLLLAKRRS